MSQVNGNRRVGASYGGGWGDHRAQLYELLSCQRYFPLGLFFVIEHFFIGVFKVMMICMCQKIEFTFFLLCSHNEQAKSCHVSMSFASLEIHL